MTCLLVRTEGRGRLNGAILIESKVRVLIKRLVEIQNKQCEVGVVDQRRHDFHKFRLPSCVNHVQELYDDGFLGTLNPFYITDHSLASIALSEGEGEGTVSLGSGSRIVPEGSWVGSGSSSSVKFLAWEIMSPSRNPA